MFSRCVSGLGLVLLCLTVTIDAQAIEQKYRILVVDFVAAVKSGDKAAIAEFIGYPLSRKYPIPAVNNKQEFVDRYDEIFDTVLVGKVDRSDIDKDWGAMGWRGIMFGSGEIWMGFNGKISSINYQSPLEAERLATIIKQQKSVLHSSIKTYSKPVLEWKTRRFRIRIDEMSAGKFRYASWSVDKPVAAKPDLVLQSGALSFDGSGGNHYYTFINGKYRYVCYVSYIGGENDAPGTLRVYKDEKEILDEPVIEVLGR